MALVRDAEYAAVVERERPLLQACAYLLTGNDGRADRLVQLVLARMYERWHDVHTPRVEALRGLVQTSPHDPQLPWDTSARVQLVDGDLAEPASTNPIVADLSRLPPDQRSVIVLERYAELPSVQIGQIVGRTVDEVLLLARQARATLTFGHPERADDAQLAAELREAVPLDRRAAYDGAADLAHGRQLVRRRWLRRGLATVAALVLVVAGVVVLLPDRTPTPVAAPPPAATPTPAAQRRCDPAELTCRGEILRIWRAEMAVVVQSYLDPQGKYFSGYGYRYDQRYDTPGFWSGNGGALAFDMFRLGKGATMGATVVYLQIATDRRMAVRCGETVGEVCQRQTFLSGNSFSLTQTSSVTEGMEVQYRPAGREVITVIARNTTKGQIYEIPRGDLIRLVQDRRLKLPAI
jgi:DNA-directed RNA polymerase specialized sigma24 family protein